MTILEKSLGAFAYMQDAAYMEENRALFARCGGSCGPGLLEGLKRLDAGRDRKPWVFGQDAPSHVEVAAK